MRQHAYGPNVHIAYDDGTVQCPRCKAQLKEPRDERWTKAINASKKCYTWTTCKCGHRVGIAECVMRGLVGFTIRKDSYYRHRDRQLSIAKAHRSGYYRMMREITKWNIQLLPA